MFVIGKKSRVILAASLLAAGGLFAEGRGAVIQVDADTVVALALEKSFRLQMERIQVDVAVEGVSEARGVYDPELSLSSQVEENYGDRSDSGETSHTDSHELTVSGILPTATGYEIEATHESNDAVSDDRYTRSLSLTVSQPLMRDRFGSITRSRIRIAASKYDTAREGLHEAVSNTIAKALFAYYDAYAAQKNYLISLENERITQKLFDATQARVEMGAISPSDMFQAKSELLLRQVEKEEAHRLLSLSLNRLRPYISDQIEGILDIEIELVEPGVPAYEKKDMIMALEDAFSHRPDLAQAFLGVSQAELEALVARGEALPQVDVFAGINYYDTDEDYGDHWESFVNEQNKQVVLGLEFSWPVPNRAAFANRRKALAQVRKAKLSLDELRQSIYLELDNGINNIETQWRRLQKAQKARALAEASLNAEEEKFESGNSSTFIILRLQGDLASARVNELGIANAYRKTLVEYDRLTGEALARYRIEI